MNDDFILNIPQKNTTRDEHHGWRFKSIEEIRSGESYSAAPQEEAQLLLLEQEDFSLTAPRDVLPDTGQVLPEQSDLSLQGLSLIAPGATLLSQVLGHFEAQSFSPIAPGATLLSQVLEHSEAQSFSPMAPGLALPSQVFSQVPQQSEPTAPGLVVL